MLFVTLALAFVTETAGLSLELGAFLAGMLIGETEFRYQVEEDIAPFRDVRAQVRAAHEANGTPYLEVHVSTPVEVASERDVKGLYARQRVGEISGLTGVDDPYEEPLEPDLVIATHEHPVEESVILLIEHLTARGLAGIPTGQPSAEYA